MSERLDEVIASSKEMVKPTVYGQLVIFLVFLPCLTFQGVEGKMFSPMVITLMLALASAFVLSLTFVPAMIAVLLRKEIAEKEVKIIVATKQRYRPLLTRAVQNPMPFVGAGVAVLALAAFAFTFVGREFMPTLDEQNSEPVVGPYSIDLHRAVGGHRSAAGARRAEPAGSQDRVLQGRYGQPGGRSDAAQCVGQLHHPQTQG